jgi:signal transduction histidine kinase
MFKTIFSKLIAIFLLILIVAFAIAGVMLNFFLEDYVTEEKANTLETATTWVNLVFENYLDHIDLDDYVNIAASELLLRESLVNYGNYFESYIWIVNQEGYLFRSNWDMPQSIVDRYTDETGYIRIPDSNLPRMVQGETTARYVGDFNGFFKEVYFSKQGNIWLTVAQSFKYSGANGNDAMAIIYMHTPVEEVIAARTKVLSYFAVSVGIAIAVAIVLIYIFSRRLSSPLKQIKHAVSRISNGEFEKRVSINSSDEIGELAKAFNQMAVALQSIEQMRREFIANISHELRTPMTSIRGFVEGILDGTIPQESQDHYLTIVRDETNRLNRLVNDLLDMARREAGEIKLNPVIFDINELVRRCVIKLEAFLLEKNLTVDAVFEEEEMAVMGDMDAIERVVYNLMHNAIKFTPVGGSIGLITKKHKDAVEVTVKDTGIGIEQEELDIIWDRFYKSDKSRSKDKTGTGLGLAIARKIINEHGQTIRVESKPGEGAAFIFTLANADREADDNIKLEG